MDQPGSKSVGTVATWDSRELEKKERATNGEELFLQYSALQRSVATVLVS